MLDQSNILGGVIVDGSASSTNEGNGVAKTPDAEDYICSTCGIR